MNEKKHQTVKRVNERSARSKIINHTTSTAQHFTEQISSKYRSTHTWKSCMHLVNLSFWIAFAFGLNDCSYLSILCLFFSFHILVSVDSFRWLSDFRFLLQTKLINEKKKYLFHRIFTVDGDNVFHFQFFISSLLWIHECEIDNQFIHNAFVINSSFFLLFALKNSFFLLSSSSFI